MKRWALICSIVLVLIAGVAATPAHAFDGRLIIARTLRIDEPVHGDLVSLGSVVTLGPHARVDGDVVAVYGKVQRANGAEVRGRIIEISSLAGLDLVTAGVRHPDRVIWGIRLLIWGFWLLVTSLISLMWPVAVGRGVWITRHTHLRSWLVGVMAVMTLVAVLVAAVAAGPAIGVPLGGAIVLLLLAAKIFGLSVLGALLGRWILLHGLHRRVPETYETFAGVTVLLALRMLPWLGGALWALVSVWAVGVAVMTPVLYHAMLPSLAAADRASQP